MIMSLGKLILLLSIFAVPLFGFTRAQDNSGLIFPDPARKIVLVAQDKCSDSIPCGHLIPSTDPFGRLVLEQLNWPFHQEVIAVSQCLRNFAKDLTGPNVLYLSSNEGGFPRQGLILSTEIGSQKYPNLNFVDLVLDKARLEKGDLNIYSHELGHVMMSIIGPGFPDGQSAKQHVSMGITDYSKAFMEGWGEHFQRLANERVAMYHEQFESNFSPDKLLNRIWHSNMDEELRIQDVKENDYIYRKLLPGVDTTGMTLAQLIYLEHTSPIFDRTRLKSAQEMLSCEGVLATLFYRFDTDSLLTNNYREKAFYDRFLIKPLPENMDIKTVFSPLENVLLKNAYVWSRMKGHITDSSVLATEFVKEWGNTFPDEKKKITSLFLLTTMGRTVNNDLGALYEQMAYKGMVGDMKTYRKLSNEFMNAFVALRDDVLADKVALDANVGPQLWVENKDFMMPLYVFFPDPTVPLNVNMNTASVFDLASFKGMTMDSAAKLIKARDRLGFFKTLDEAKSLGFKM